MLRSIPLLVQSEFTLHVIVFIVSFLLMYSVMGPQGATRFLDLPEGGNIVLAVCMATMISFSFVQGVTRLVASVQMAVGIVLVLVAVIGLAMGVMLLYTKWENQM